MPRAIEEAGLIDEFLPLEEIAARITDLVGGIGTAKPVSKLRKGFWRAES